jgi:hypothetical protein
VSLQGPLRTLGRPPTGAEDEQKSIQRCAAAKELTVFSLLKSLGNAFDSGRHKAARLRPRPRLTVEQLEDRVLLNGGPHPPPPQGINPLSSPHIDLLNDHFLLNFAGHHAELTVTSEDLSPGRKTSQIGGVFIDPSTGVTAACGGQLSLTNTTKNGYPVENLVLEGFGSGLFVFFTGTVWGAGSGGNFFGNDQLSGTGSEGLPPYYAVRGPVSGNDYDPIAAKYQSLGGAKGVLGKWVSMEMTTPYGGAIYQKFQNGAIYWSFGTGAHELHGMIWVEWQKTATEFDYNGTAVQKDLGLPTSDEFGVPGVLRENTFENGGTIYWSPNTGAHAVYGPFAAKYNALGGPAVYGLPTSDAAALPLGQLIPDCWVQYFHGGNGGDGAIIRSASTGVHEIHGQILGEWENTASETDFNGTVVQNLLGAPTSDEMDVAGVPGARMNTFQHGTIYWSGSTGAHAVIGPIGGLHDSLGGPTSYLGLPTTNEIAIPNGREQYFQNGKIVWTLQDGAHAYQAVSSIEYDNYNDDKRVWAVNGDSISSTGMLTVYQDGSYHFTGDFRIVGLRGLDYKFEITLVTPSGATYTAWCTGHVGPSAPWNHSDSYWDFTGFFDGLEDNWGDLWGCKGSWHCDAW